MREIVFDTETTGLSAREGHRVIEIGAVELADHFPTGKTFHVYINPQDKKVDQGAFDVHGISNEFLQDKPVFADIASDFSNFISDAILIAHNANFDVEFLNTELKRVDQPLISNDRVIDTLQIARKKYPMGPNSLDALCSRLGIDNSRRTKHGALLDSEILAEVYLELIGGRQTALGLGDTREEKSSSAGVQKNHGPQRQRPKELPSRLTDQELKAHEDFIATLGDDAIWGRYNKA